MEIPVDAIKELRNKTGAGILDCTKALKEAGGDLEKALESLKSRGLAIAEKRKDRTATEGIVEAYIHHTRQLGALVELNCETDFVAHTNEFRGLARDLAMQVAAMSPQFISEEEIPEGSDVEPQTACLLLQPYIRDPSKTVQDIITEAIAKVGENIKVSRFVRFELGEREDDGP